MQSSGFYFLFLCFLEFSRCVEVNEELSSNIGNSSMTVQDGFQPLSYEGSTCSNNVSESARAGAKLEPFENCDFSITSLIKGRMHGCQCSVENRPLARYDVEVVAYLESCQDSNEMTQQTACMCSPLCWLFGDCCPDYFRLKIQTDVRGSDESLFLAELQSGELTNFQNVLRFYETIYWFRLSSCEPLWPDFSTRFYLVSRCAAEEEAKTKFDHLYRKIKRSKSPWTNFFLAFSQQEIISRCEEAKHNKSDMRDDPLNFFPAFAKRGKAKADFYNVFCAVCNAIDPGGLQFWKMKLTSTNRSESDSSVFVFNLRDFKNALKNYKLDLIEGYHSTKCFSPLNPALGRDKNYNNITVGDSKFKYLEYSVDSNRSEMEMMCKRYLFIIREKGKLFSNPHCYHLAVRDEKVLDFDFIQDIAVASFVCYTLSLNQSKRLRPDQILGEVKIFHNDSNSMSNESQCLQNETYNTFYLKCLAPVCPKDTRFSKDTCQETHVDVEEKIVHILHNSNDSSETESFNFEFENQRRIIVVNYALSNALNTLDNVPLSMNEQNHSTNHRRTKGTLGLNSPVHEFLLEWMKIQRPRTFQQLEEHFFNLIKEWVINYNNFIKVKIKEIDVFAYISTENTEDAFLPCPGVVLVSRYLDCRYRRVFTCRKLMSKTVAIGDETFANPCAVLITDLSHRKRLVYDTCLSVKVDLKWSSNFHPFVSALKGFFKYELEILPRLNLIVVFKIITNVYDNAILANMTRSSMTSRIVTLDPKLHDDYRAEFFPQQEIETQLCPEDKKMMTLETEASDVTSLKIANVSHSMAAKHWIEMIDLKVKDGYLHILTYIWCQTMPLKKRCPPEHLQDVSLFRGVLLNGVLVVTDQYNQLVNYLNKSRDELQSSNITQIIDCLKHFATKYKCTVDIYARNNYLILETGFSVCSSFKQFISLKSSVTKMSLNEILTFISLLNFLSLLNFSS